MRPALAVALLLALAAPAQAQTGPSSYDYGVDAFMRCGGAPAQRVPCVQELAGDLTDGGQLERTPRCYVEVLRRPQTLATQHWRCPETYLGTDLQRLKSPSRRTSSRGTPRSPRDRPRARSRRP